MSFPQADPDRMLADFQSRIDAKLRQADQLQAATAQLRVRSTSPDGSVTVTVDSTGNLSDLALTPAAMAKRPEEASALIVATLRGAQAQVGERVREALAPLIGGESATMGMLMSGYEGRFGGAEQPAPPRRPDGGDDGDDDDFGRRDSWLRD